VGDSPSSSTLLEQTPIMRANCR